jgi:hypothetical protein
MHPLTARTALLVSAMLVAAGCGSAAAPAPHAGPGLRLVTYHPAAGQAIPSTLVATTGFDLRPSAHAAYACFTAGGKPLEWPPGYSAVVEQDGNVRILGRSGRVVLRTGMSVQWDQVDVTSRGDACSKAGTTVTAIIDIVPGHFSAG